MFNILSTKLPSPHIGSTNKLLDLSMNITLYPANCEVVNHRVRSICWCKKAKTKTEIRRWFYTSWRGLSSLRFKFWDSRTDSWCSGVKPNTKFKGRGHNWVTFDTPVIHLVVSDFSHHLAKGCKMVHIKRMLTGLSGNRDAFSFHPHPCHDGAGWGVQQWLWNRQVV